ncbi:MAG: HTH domain-containing protein [Candidatus Moraniibacteriota bacterium]
MTAPDTRAEGKLKHRTRQIQKTAKMEKAGKISRKDASSRGFYGTAFHRFLHSISPRAVAIVSARYGAGGKEPMTLEEIGKTYGITRERIRQIISVLLGNVRARRYPASLEEVSKRMESTLMGKSGIMKRQVFFEAIAGTDTKEQGAARFFLAVLSERFRMLESNSMTPSIAVASFADASWEAVNTAAKTLLVENGESLLEAEFLKRIAKHPSLKAVSQKTILDFLAVSEDCRKNPFGQWGLPEWSDICPRGTRERAYLVVRAEGKPLHFREIAAKIDQSGLQKPGKVTHPQTVHNELIKDKRFVLVGRGTYALVEWGFRRGTVREVVEEILRERGVPVKRDELVSAVLKVRDVKASTVVINLNAFFARTPEGTYSLKESKKRAK